MEDAPLLGWIAAKAVPFGAKGLGAALSHREDLDRFGVR